MHELRAEEPDLYRGFVRMTADQFDHLLQLVTPYIQKKDTNMRLSISPATRLTLALRYLATGENFTSLQYIFRVPQTTISRIIPETLDAIYNVLVQDYVKVSFGFANSRHFCYFYLIYSYQKVKTNGKKYPKNLMQGGISQIVLVPLTANI